MANTNCLEGMRCPACGQETAFLISLQALGRVEDSGITEYTDPVWNGSSYCECAGAGCTHNGTVRDFMRHLPRLKYDAEGWYILPPGSDVPVAKQSRYLTRESALIAAAKELKP